MSNLSEKRCLPCEGGVKPLSEAEAKEKLAELDGWSLNTEETPIISKHFEFKNFYRTMAFVNAVAWVANKKNHHPDIELGYNYCHVKFHTHAIVGLSENDFICAAKIDRL